ncbi:MAG TPA: biotin carboxylase N-terminal domain-containing protein, partial [Hyphomicrobiaceae bacterium]|nr:biotin carboxylase N-terminal domain-containing protein [Hyphomicrobiaceae bacterium]
IRTARRLGVSTVAVVSEADRGAPFARVAGEAVEIGPGPAPESYLRGDRIIAAARATGAEAIHPGYGFLAENADFAEAVREAGLTFIGPSPEAMRRMGGKAEAKAIAAAAGVPVVPGYAGDRQDATTLAREAGRIGYPVLIKAVAGGGGRGMRLVEREDDMAAALESAQREAQAAFGDDRVLLEKLITQPRHVEVQVFGDRHGNAVHLYERDCSLQRRNQKVIEEAPAPGMSPALRARMCAAAIACARAVAYEGAGTVEFLVEGGELEPEAAWYFIEMNTRLQVEHPVTEAITGLDLVEWQLRVAAGETLPLRQDEIRMQGHAIEARLNAEDPARGFLPSTGRLVRCELAGGEGIRIEAGFEQDDVVSPYYDSMLAKLIAFGPDRATAIGHLAAELERDLIAGPKTNLAFLHALLTHPAFVAGRTDTGLVGRDLESLTAVAPDPCAIAYGIAQMLWRAREDLEGLRRQRAWGEAASPWNADDGFQLGGMRRQSLTVLVDGTPTPVQVSWGTAGAEVHLSSEEGALAAVDRHPGPDPSSPRRPSKLDVGADPVSIPVQLAGDSNPLYVLHALHQTELRWPTYQADAADHAGDGSAIRAPIIGRVAKLLVKAGDTVAKGDRIAVVEAMKMEHVLHAVRDGVVTKVAVAEGQQVEQGALIAALTE